jgi:hypothetical protein
MSSLKELTSWRKRKVPDDIFHLVEDYIAPYKCFACQKFLSINERLCENCSTPIFQEYENMISLFDICIEIKDKVKDEQEVRTLIEIEITKYKENLPIGSLDISKRYYNSIQKDSEIKNLHKIAVKKDVRCRYDAPTEKEYGKYFKKIDYDDYFHYRKIIENLTPLIEEIKRIRYYLDSVFSHPEFYKKMLVKNYENFKKICIITC